MLRVIIAEEDPITCFLLKTLMDNIKDIELINEIRNCDQLVKIAKESKPDIIFIDIHMSEMEGLKAAREISEITPNIYIIFTTISSKYALEAFNLYAFDYIIKPFKFKRIDQTISRIRKLTEDREQINNQKLMPLKKNKESKIIVHSKGISMVINIYEIVIITRVERRTVIYTLNDTIQVYDCLENFEKKLGKSFFRCHKGYIINLNQVKKIIPWGKKTYLIMFANTNETALATCEKVKMMKEKLCLS